VDELAIVMAVGLDKPKQNGKVQFIAQIFSPSGQKKGGKGDSGGSGGFSYWNIISSGDTVSSAVQEAIHKVPREIYFSHNQVIIFGRNIAKDGLQKYIDFFLREQQSRLNIWILVAKDRADATLDITPQLENMPALDIADLVEMQDEASQSSVVNLKQFATRLMSKTTAPIAPFIEVTGKGDKKTVRLSGTAVLKKDKLVGQLNLNETRGLLWVIDEVRRGIIEVDCLGGSGKASLNIIRAKRKIVPEIKGSKIHMKIEIKEDGILGSQSCRENLATPPKIAALEKKKANAIRSEILAALKKARKLRADIFGFGDAIHQKYPKQWKELESKWDEVFPEIEVEITVDAEIRRSGRIIQPAAPEKE
jgi:spore germination protein KC